ncbi:unannotated protein [freshwater metagenome]|uniref:Unannotated protein n=1 Tax=freshwater metagenome TaxID=449393 RepID=A0A6J6F122_9ZZZZ
MIGVSGSPMGCPSITYVLLNTLARSMPKSGRVNGIPVGFANGFTRGPGRPSRWCSGALV